MTQVYKSMHCLCKEISLERGRRGLRLQQGSFLVCLCPLCINRVFVLGSNCSSRTCVPYSRICWPALPVFPNISGNVNNFQAYALA